MENIKRDTPIPSELGYDGLKIVSGHIFEESRYDLQFPQNIVTYNKMAQHPAIASALNAVFMLASRVEFSVEPYNLTEFHKKKSDFVQSCLDDMEISWYDFIREALSFTKYGFSVHEKVYRRRRKKNGSKYDDGYVGIKKLPIRAQDSIHKWEFKEDRGRKFSGLVQRVEFNDSGVFRSTEIRIPRDKFLLFRVDPARGNPEGTSPLNACYSAWKTLQKLLDSELIATSKNLNGVPVATLPAQYMADDATSGQKKVYEAIVKGVKNVNNGEQAGIVLPSDTDEITKAKLFSFDVVNSSSSNITSLSSIVSRYNNEIYQALFADVLQMGVDKSGSYNLADNKTSMLLMLVEARLKEVVEVINRDLIPELFRLNGWDETKTPKLVFETLNQPDPTELAKALQQMKAVKLIAPTAKNINHIAKLFGLPDRVDENLPQEDVDKLMGVEQQDDSRSGDGLAKGSGNGTSDKVSEDDNSASNLDNA